jgi:hypothetical protein
MGVLATRFGVLADFLVAFPFGFDAFGAALGAVGRHRLGAVHITVSSGAVEPANPKMSSAGGGTELLKYILGECRP